MSSMTEKDRVIQFLGWYLSIKGEHLRGMTLRQIVNQYRSSFVSAKKFVDRILKITEKY